MAKKKMVTVETGYSFSRYDFEGNLDIVIERLTDARDACIEGMYTNLTIEDDAEMDHFVVYGERLETDEEFEKRIKQAERSKKKRENEKLEAEQYERKRLAELIDKYGVPE